LKATKSMDPISLEIGNLMNLEHIIAVPLAMLVQFLLCCVIFEVLPA